MMQLVVFKQIFCSYMCLSHAEAAAAATRLFYEITKHISVESKQYGPSSQFFTSVIEILGQVQNWVVCMCAVTKVYVSVPIHVAILIFNFYCVVVI